MSGAPPEKPGRSERGRHPWPVAVTALLMLIGFVLVVLTYRDYGITWDEGMQSRYGEQAVEYFRRGFVEPEKMNRSVIRYCGPLFELIPALVYQVGDFARYETRHLVLALIALLIIPGLALYARLSGDSWIPVYAVIALMMMPRFYGHMFNNSKDVPFALTAVWFMWATGRMMVEADLRWRRFILLGVTLGLVLCARPGGLPLVAGIALGGVVIAVVQRRPRLPRLHDPLPMRASATLGLKVLVALLIAWALMVAPWPWAHGHVLTHPIKAMRAAADFPVLVDMRFEGQTIRSDHLPARYLPEYLLITVPPSLLALAAVGLACAVRRQVAEFRRPRSLFYGLTEVWLFGPIVAFVILRPRAYDGMRHFLFILPALAVLAGVGAAGVVALARRWRLKLVAWIVVGAALLAPLVSMVRLHPYQSTYFNFLVGGVSGAQGRYETDYWVASYREAMLWINAQAERRPGQRCHVLIGGNPSLGEAASYYAADNVTTAFTGTPPYTAELPADADYYLATTRFGAAYLYPDSPIVHTVGRRDAVFTVIKAHHSP
jgi:hypothetical protein